MLTTAPKEIRENVARATGYLRRDDVERSLLTMAEALRRYAGVRLVRSARAELDIQIDEFLSTLIRHHVMQPLLDPDRTGKPRAIPFQPGKEAALSTVLEGLAKILQKEAAHSEAQEAAARQERKKRLIETGLQFLQEGQTAKGRAFLKRVAEEYSDEKDIRLQLGHIFAAAGQDVEAAAMYEEAMEAQPREAAAYTGAVAAWLRLREYEKAENVYKAVLRTFGGIPPPLAKWPKCIWNGIKNRRRRMPPCAPCKATPTSPTPWKSWRPWSGARTLQRCNVLAGCVSQPPTVGRRRRFSRGGARTLARYDKGSYGLRQQRQLRMQTAPLCICALERRNKPAGHAANTYSQRQSALSQDRPRKTACTALRGRSSVWDMSLWESAVRNGPLQTRRPHHKKSGKGGAPP